MSVRKGFDLMMVRIFHSAFIRVDEETFPPVIAPLTFRSTYIIR